MVLKRQFVDYIGKDASLHICHSDSPGDRAPSADSITQKMVLKRLFITDMREESACSVLSGNTAHEVGIIVLLRRWSWKGNLLVTWGKNLLCTFFFQVFWEMYTKLLSWVELYLENVLAMTCHMLVTLGGETEWLLLWSLGRTLHNVRAVLQQMVLKRQDNQPLHWRRCCKSLLIQIVCLECCLYVQLDKVPQLQGRNIVILFTLKDDNTAGSLLLCQLFYVLSVVTISDYMCTRVFIQ